MKLSIFTPTHNPKYILDLWETIKDQPGDWEWVIVYNGVQAPNERKKIKRRKNTIKDDRVKQLIYPKRPYKANEHESRIGVLKRWACSQCTGDILVEVDHDDLLAPNCLEKIAKAFEDPEVGFVYSDFCEFYDDSWNSQVYGSNSGWKTYPVVFQDKTLIAHEAFEPDPRSVCQIEFAPNHVRAWRKTVYDELGGHADLSAGDDHELVCRTYLATKMKRIPECLYFYRRLPQNNNSYLKRYKEIRVQENANRNKFLYKLVEKWADDNNLPKVDLGAAHGKPEGYLGLDIEPDTTDITCDVTKGLPFEDNSVGIIRAVDFLEHIPNKIQIINEIYRVLAPGGWLFSITPSTDGRGAFQDPTHISFYNQNSFWYYTDEKFKKYIPALDCKFQPVRLFTNFPSQWHQTNNICYVYADLIAVKEGYRPPGIVNFSE